MQFGAGRALDAVIRPEGLVHRHRLGKLDDVKNLEEYSLVMHTYSSKCFSKTNRQFRSALFDDPVLPEVGVGEEGDVVLGVPVDGVDDEVKVARRLVKEVVEWRDDLEPVLLRGGVPEGERAGEEAVLHVDHEEGGRRRRQDGLDPLPVLRLTEELVPTCSDADA